MRLAADEWIDGNGLTWIERPPKIRLLKENDRSDPYPLDWGEQERLFGELPLYLRRMAPFAVNTGCRDQEICKLKWDWEIQLPELNKRVHYSQGKGEKQGRQACSAQFHCQGCD